MPHTTGSILTLIFLSILFVLTSSYYILTVGLRLVGWYLLRQSETRRELILKELAEKHGGGIYKKGEAVIVGFFHPFCHAGGGGERVLWAAIRATQTKYPNAVCAVYTGDHDVDRSSMLKRVKDRFSIPLDSTRIIFIYVSHRRLVSPTLYPHFTLLMQSFGSIPLTYSALSLLVPDIFIDTMGYPFSYPFVKLLFGNKRVPVGAYVHYPTISTDMLDSLPSEDTSFKMKVKKDYWKMFALMYRACGSSVDVVMANSSWTARHIRSLWTKQTTSEYSPGGVKIVFPPCSVSEITSAIPITATARQPYILSIAQFRPEKRIDLLIKSFSKFINNLPAKSPLKSTAKLILLGSVRGDDDAKRVYELRLLAHEEGVKDQIEFVLNAPWREVLGWLGKSWVGVNAMWNEHFGIGVVEYLAAGLVGVVHDSGGPKEDIVVDGLGYHATDVPSFASAFQTALSLPKAEIFTLRKRAQASSSRFSEEVFAKGWLEAMEELMDLMPPRKKYF